MRSILVTTLLLLTASLAGCLTDVPSISSTNVGGCSDVGGPSPPEPQSESFSGSTDTATEFIFIQQDIFKISATHQGSSNFIAWLVDSNGEEIELLFNVIGSYEGSHYIAVDAGTYAFNVDAGGEWSLTIEQIRPTTNYNASEQVIAFGDTAFDPVYLECGLAHITLSYRGDSNFIVWLYDADGQTIDLVANEIGDYDGSTYINIPSTGVYLIDITARDGTWGLSIAT
jgi:hypothetical protein